MILAKKTGGEDVQTIKLLASIIGIGALLVLAGLLAGAPAEASAAVGSGSLQCPRSHDTSLSETASLGGQASDMDDDDADDGDPQATAEWLPEDRHGQSSEALALMGVSAMDELAVIHPSSPCRGRTLRRRIFKKS